MSGLPIIAIDPGHNCSPDIGASYEQYNENQIVLGVAQQLAKICQSKGIKTIDCLPKSAPSVLGSLQQRCAKSNAAGATIYVSIHCNMATPTTEARGCEVFAKSAAGKAIAANINQELSELGFKNRGVKEFLDGGSVPYVIRNTNAVSVLIEICFLDSTEDVKILNQKGLNKIAQAIFDGLTKGITFTSDSKDFSNDPVPSPIEIAAVKPTIRKTFLADCCDWDKNLDHQTEAWLWLQENIDPKVLATFADKFSPDHDETIGLADESIPKSKTGSIDWNDPEFKIGKYFKVEDVTKGDRERVPTDPRIISNILSMAIELDIIREEWGSAIGVSSWYRPMAVNRKARGVRNSQHIKGRGVDVYPLDGRIFEFQSWLDKNWYGGLGYGARKGFVHLDNRNGKGWKDGGEKGDRWNY